MGQALFAEALPVAEEWPCQLTQGIDLVESSGEFRRLAPIAALKSGID